MRHTQTSAINLKYIFLENDTLNISNINFSNNDEYNDYGDIFHITNLTYFRELINSDKSYSNKKYRYNNLQGNNENEVAYINDLDTEPEIEIIETLLEQIQNKDTRYKRGINELGSRRFSVIK